MSNAELVHAISLRVSKTDRDALDGLAARLNFKALTIARLAFRLGLGQIARDPSILVKS